MNEKIRELALQAGLTFVNSITDDNEDIECIASIEGGLPCSTELEKFAELIVREHIKLLQQEWYDINNEEPSDLLPRDIGFKVGRKSEIVVLIEKIKQEFGVEE